MSEQIDAGRRLEKKIQAAILAHRDGGQTAVTAHASMVVVMVAMLAGLADAMGQPDDEVLDAHMLALRMGMALVRMEEAGPKH